MDSLRNVGGVFGSVRVEQRSGGGSKRQGDAFRQALQQEQGEDGTEREPAVPDRTPSPTSRSARRPANLGGDASTARHIDVIA